MHDKMCFSSIDIFDQKSRYSSTTSTANINGAINGIQREQFMSKSLRADISGAINIIQRAQFWASLNF